MPKFLRYWGAALLVVAVASAGCGKAAQIAVTADDSMFAKIEQVKITKDSYCDAGTLPASSCVALAKAFVPVWDGYLALNRALASGTPLQNAQTTITAIRQASDNFLAEVRRLQDGEGRRILEELIIAALARLS